MVQPAQSAPAGRKRRTEEAIRLAMAGDWKAAAAANEALLADFEDDVEAANRLGKAYTELEQPKKAIKAYERALEIDTFNAIARKNLERLQTAAAPVKAKPKSPAGGGAGARPKGKAAKPSTPKGGATALVASATAAEFRLQQANPAEIAKLEPGDVADLQTNNRGVAVVSEDDTVLGYIEPRAGLRLRRMIEGGNEYAVTIRSIDDAGNAVVFIRETFRHPSLVGQASFLASAETRKKAPRAYTRRSALIDEDEPEITDEDSEDDEVPMSELDEMGDVDDDDPPADELGIVDDDSSDDDDDDLDDEDGADLDEDAEEL